ncbi:MAG: hypothetical protein GX039_07330 [Clostridia bacterium]|nr:hypothetical protein [Clostridia bacterium]
MPGNTVDVRLRLSKLELQVATLSRAGLTRWQIAAVLGLRKGTIKSQLERVKYKLGPDWKENASLRWPILDPDVQQAVRDLKIPAGFGSGREGSAAPGQKENLTPDTGGQAPPAAASGPVAALPADNEIAATLTRQNIGFDTARQALEGGLSPEEAAIIHLQGLPSRAGSTYLKKARSVQWQIMLNKDRTLYVNPGARFWLKPALGFLTDNRYLRFFHSDKTSEPYRPWWLPYISSNRVRATRAAYYKMADNSAAEYSRFYLDKWIKGELELYAARLHALMQQRWQALHRIARSAGRGTPEAPPTLEELITAAQAALGLD